MKTFNDLYESYKAFLKDPRKRYAEDCEEYRKLIREDNRNLWWYYSFCKKLKYLREYDGVSFVRMSYEDQLKEVSDYLGMPVNDEMKEGVMEFHEAFRPEHIAWFFEQVEGMKK